MPCFSVRTHKVLAWLPLPVFAVIELIAMDLLGGTRIQRPGFEYVHATQACLLATAALNHLYLNYHYNTTPARNYDIYTGVMMNLNAVAYIALPGWSPIFAGLAVFFTYLSKREMETIWLAMGHLIYGEIARGGPVAPEGFNGSVILPGPDYEIGVSWVSAWLISISLLFLARLANVKDVGTQIGELTCGPTTITTTTSVTTTIATTVVKEVTEVFASGVLPPLDPKALEEKKHQ